MKSILEKLTKQMLKESAPEVGKVGMPKLEMPETHNWKKRFSKLKQKMSTTNEVNALERDTKKNKNSMKGDY